MKRKEADGSGRAGLGTFDAGGELTLGQLDSIGKLTVDSISVECKDGKVIIKVDSPKADIKSSTRQPTITVCGKTYEVKDIC
ncbi:hypothetical protein FJZ26_01930 [Candidatus Parvarchaeota archaeon]|nr:hypothetical protein [Candidatus Parvarchaeota archaeon]